MRTNEKYLMPIAQLAFMTLKVSHVWLYVKDTSQSIRFYSDILGFKLVAKFADGALLDAGGVLIGLHREVLDRKSPHCGNTIILETGDVERSFKELSEKGVKFATPVRQEDYGIVADFRDPDGYILELWQPV